MQAQISGLQRALNTRKPNREELHKSVNNIQSNCKRAKGLIQEVENISTRSRGEQDAKIRTTSKLNTELETLVHRFQQQVQKVSDLDRAEIEEIKKSFTEESRRSFIEDAAKTTDTSYSPSQLEILEFDEQVLHEREQELANMQAVMLDVRDIMADCALMVDEQGEMIDRIENDVEMSALHTTKANDELEKADKHQRQAQRSMWKTFVVLAILTCMAIVIGTVCLKYLI